MTLRSSLRDAARRTYLSITRGTLVKADDAHQWQEVMIRGLHGEVIEGVEAPTSYGFSSHPKAPTAKGEEAEVILAELNGRSLPIALVIGDRRYRLKGLAEGEVALHDDQGQKVHLTRSGILVEAPEGKQVQATVGSTSVTITKDDITQTVGAVTMKHSAAGIDFTGGYLKHNGKRIDATHVHGGVTPGAANTGVPAN